MTAATTRPRHAPFAQTTAERCAPEESHRLPPPPDALPFGEAYAALVTAEQSALIDALIEHAIGPAADALLARIEARFDAVERRLARLTHLGLIHDRDTRRPAPRQPDTQPPPAGEPPFDPDPPEPSDPGPAQVPPPAENVAAGLVSSDRVRCLCPECGAVAHLHPGTTTYCPNCDDAGVYTALGADAFANPK